MARKPPGRAPRRGAKYDGPNPVDVHVGGRVRQRRMMIGMSQEKLAEALGLTFQQVQKYERGANRISASRLLDMSRALAVSVASFFEELPEQSAPARGLAEPPAAYEADPMLKRETVELVRAYYRINDAAVRRRLFELTKALARSYGADPEKT